MDRCINCGHEGLEEFSNLKRCPRCGSQIQNDGSVIINEHEQQSTKSFDEYHQKNNYKYH